MDPESRPKIDIPVSQTAFKDLPKASVENFNVLDGKNSFLTTQVSEQPTQPFKLLKCQPLEEEVILC